MSMYLKNSFSRQQRELFEEFYNCGWCGMNRVDCIHHIMGRVSSSTLNMMPLHNHKCHIGNARLDSWEQRSIFLKKTLAFLLENGYQLTEEDLAFKEKFQNYYN